MVNSQTTPVDLLADIRTRHIALMQTTAATLGHILAPLSQEQATTLRDEPDGWTVLEVLGHLRDFDAIFRRRAALLLEQDYPTLAPYDHEAMAVEREYNRQDLRTAYEEFIHSRQQTIAFFASLTDAQWERAGVHPERGHFPMTAACLQVGLHEVGHLEQITRILLQRV